MMRMKVDLPQPDGPMTVINSRRWMSSETPSKTVRVEPLLPKVFFKSRTPESELETEPLVRAAPVEPGKQPLPIAVVAPPMSALRDMADGGATPVVAIPREASDASAAVAVVNPSAAIDAGAPRDMSAGSGTVAARPPRPLVAPIASPKPKGPTPVEPTPAPKPVVAAVRPSGNAGMVHFKTPGGVADVYVDGNKAGVTPLVLSLSPGRHSFEFKVEGFEFGGPKTLNISAGGDINIEVDLR